MPAMDGSRPGIFYANLYDLKATPKYDMRTLAYHEAIPGHHFQIAIAQELEGLHFDGWQFTALPIGHSMRKRVAWEAGFQNDPLLIISEDFALSSSEPYAWLLIQDGTMDPRRGYRLYVR